MTHRIRIAIAITAASIAFFSFTDLQAANEGFAIYFPDSTLTLTPQTINRVVYLPLAEIVQHLKLSYSDATALETFTIRTPNSRIVATRNSGLVSVNDQIVLLNNPVRYENNQWLAPADFLPLAVSRVTGIEFRYRAGSSRMFAGVEPEELSMAAQTIGALTRLTIRARTPIRLTLRRNEASPRAEFLIDRKPMDPARERLDYRSRLVESIMFDDADGVPKIVAAGTDQLGDIRLTSLEEGRAHVVDFFRKGENPDNVAAPPPTAASSLDPRQSLGGIRVIVIDPGHGGSDAGVKAEGVQEKDLTLKIARSLRVELQRRFGATVLLTRDSDIDVSSEERAAVANNNQANLFISIHVGYSTKTLDSGSAIYLIQEDFAAGLSPAASKNQLFLPWFMGYRQSRQASAAMSRILQEELSKIVPGWRFPIRTGPIAVLASTTMPSVALEIGNLNNPLSRKTVTDASFHGKFVAAMASAVARFASRRAGGG